MPDAIHPQREEPLHGGNQTDGVVRVGDTVRRPAHPWSPATRALLDHLAITAPGIAPRSLGIDGEGRDIISFVDGDTGHYPMAGYMRDDASLIAAALLIRRYHDATVGLTRRLDLPWQHVDSDPSRREVICHNDIAPYNVIFQDGAPSVLFDFDHAGPGPRIRDVAHAAYRFVPLASNQSCRHFGWETLPDRLARLRRFLGTYGPFDDRGFIAMVERRVRELRDNILHLAETDPERVRTHLAEDHVGSYNSDLAWLAANREVLGRALASGARQ
jgi:hypothetical protein